MENVLSIPKTAEDIISIIHKVIQDCNQDLPAEIVSIKRKTYLIPLSSLFPKQKSQKVFLGEALFILSDTVRQLYPGSSGKFVRSTIAELKEYHGITHIQCGEYSEKRKKFESQTVTTVFDFDVQLFRAIRKTVGIKFSTNDGVLLSSYEFQKLFNQKAKNEMLQRELKKLYEYKFLVWLKQNF